MCVLYGYCGRVGFQCIYVLELDVEHRGYAYLQSGSTPTDGMLLPVLTAGQVLMNIAIALIIMRLVTAYYANLSDSENQSVVSIYWANFFLACLANAVLILGNVVLYLGINFISDISPNALSYRIVGDATTLGLVLLFMCHWCLGKVHV